MNYGISQKVSLLFIILVVVLATTLGYYFIRYQKATLEEEFDEKAKAVLHSLVVSVEYPLLVEDEKTLWILGNGVLQQKDAVFCEIRNKSGKLLFQGGSRNAKYVTQYVSPVLSERVSPLVSEDMILGSENKQTVETGKVYLTFSLEGLMDKLSQANQTIGFLVTGWIVLSCVLISLLTRLILGKPVKELMTGIKKIAEGNLNHKVPIKTQDEIGALAVSFNEMTEHLKKTVDNLNREVAERKKTELALENLNRDLGATVQQLSCSNSQLQDFVHISAHDLKTPVRGISTLADWIANDYGDKFDEHGREQIRLLKKRVVRIDKLIEGMLQFSKITRNRNNEKQVNLNREMAELITKMKPTDKIELAVDSLPVVTGERDHIMQVFENLLTNAVTFMDKPKGLIKVGCVEHGDFWKFYVSDNGPGIEQRYFERIFKIFQTLPKHDEPDTIGVGLAIAKKIIEMYGGKIWVESDPGLGSTFFFTFPKQKEEFCYERTKANTAY
ncbi:MAG: HAMP domain-containing protein [Sedimentisphaerales bacterium]|nr:HAMP domain-containing protein [Sedimentisphaerales bacterium]